ncbi:MAG: hypothetical protein ABI150_13880, partial [Nitrobacter sp.]
RKVPEESVGIVLGPVNQSGNVALGVKHKLPPEDRHLEVARRHPIYFRKYIAERRRSLFGIDTRSLTR